MAEQTISPSPRELLRGSVIKILISPDLVEFSVPAFFLQQTESFFSVALKGSFLEAQENKITLDTEDVDVFETFLFWLYQKDTPRDLLFLRESKPEGYVFCVRIYAFADRRGFPELGDLAISTLAGYIRDGEEADLQTISEAYRTCPHNSGMCRLLVHYGVLEHESHFEHCDDAVMKLYPREYVHQILRQMFYPGRNSTVHPNFHICDYHSHRASDKNKCRATCEEDEDGECV